MSPSDMMCEEEQEGPQQAEWPFKCFGKLVQGVGGRKRKVTDITMPHVTSTSANVAMGAAQGRAAWDRGKKDKRGGEGQTSPEHKNTRVSPHATRKWSHWTVTFGPKGEDREKCATKPKQTTKKFCGQQLFFFITKNLTFFQLINFMFSI